MNSMEIYLICDECQKAFTAPELEEIYADRFRCPLCEGLLKSEQLTGYDGKADYDVIVRIIQCLAHEGN